MNLQEMVIHDYIQRPNILTITSFGEAWSSIGLFHQSGGPPCPTLPE
jgi:hypothetical protein